MLSRRFLHSGVCVSCDLYVTWLRLITTCCVFQQQQRPELPQWKGQSGHSGMCPFSAPPHDAPLTDSQYTEDITWLMLNIFYSTASLPFNPDSSNPTNTNKPYLDCALWFWLEEPHILSCLHLHCGRAQFHFESDYDSQDDHDGASSHYFSVSNQHGSCII